MLKKMSIVTDIYPYFRYVKILISDHLNPPLSLSVILAPFFTSPSLDRSSDPRTRSHFFLHLVCRKKKLGVTVGLIANKAQL